MASLILFSESRNQKLEYIDKEIRRNPEEVKKYKERKENSTTIYVGSLPFDMRESHIYSTFIQCGPIKRIIIGVNKNTNKPIGFCFVEFFTRESAEIAIKCGEQTKICGRKIRVDIDVGFEEGRQYGKGANGYQRADEENSRRGQKNINDPDRPIDIK